MPLYAFSVVLRDKKDNLKHLLSHCNAVNNQEARGIAHEYLENQYKDSTVSSLLIREIIEDQPSESSTPLAHSYENTRIRSEFALPNKLL